LVGVFVRGELVGVWLLANKMTQKQDTFSTNKTKRALFNNKQQTTNHLTAGARR
jgi:hypothetical protein